MSDNFKKYASEEYVNKKIANIPQSNWDQNDETAPDYIKNRPFYKSDGAYVGMVQFVATSATTLQYTTTEDEFYTVVLPYLQTIVGEGEVCIIKIGENRGKISCIFDRGYFTFNGMFSGGGKYLIGEVWTLTINDENVVFSEGSIYNIEFYNTLDPYVKIDPGYLPNIVYTSEHAPVKFGDGANSTVQGLDTTASGTNSHAEGYGSNASGYHTHAEGYYTLTNGHGSHAEGWKTTATGNYSHAAGNQTISNQYGMYVFGEFNQAFDAFAEQIISGFDNFKPTSKYYCADDYTFNTSTGLYTLINPVLQSGVTVGKYCVTSSSNLDNLTYMYKIISTTDTTNNYNIQRYSVYYKSTNRGDYVHIVGNGTSDAVRSNAHTLDWEGNAWYSGDVYIGSTSGTNKDEGSKKLATEEYVTQKVAEINVETPTEYDAIILKSSTFGSTKKFRLTIGDDGVLSAEEITL